MMVVPCAAGEIPDFYKSVDRLVWVVEDIDQTLVNLRKIGFTDFVDLGPGSMGNTLFRGKPATGDYRVVSGRFGDVAVHWVQPYGGGNAFAEFLKTHGSGVFSLMHRTPDLSAFNSEVDRMAGLGVGALMEGSLDTQSGQIRFAFLDTEEKGKYVLGLLYFPGGDEGPLAVPSANSSGRVVTQYAFAVRELEPVSEYWAKLGFPAMEFTHGKLTNLKYRRQSADFDMRLGWQRHGSVVYEWIQSLRGPDVYLDHMKVHGEGFHHLAFGVDDMDKDLAWWTEKGYPESMSGGWGVEGEPGSGRFAYVDTQALGGTDVELLWNYSGK
jgi:hypothetical protein